MESVVVRGMNEAFSRLSQALDNYKTLSKYELDLNKKRIMLAQFNDTLPDRSGSVYRMFLDWKGDIAKYPHIGVHLNTNPNASEWNVDSRAFKNASYANELAKKFAQYGFEKRSFLIGGKNPLVLQKLGDIHRNENVSLELYNGGMFIGWVNDLDPTLDYHKRSNMHLNTHHFEIPENVQSKIKESFGKQEGEKYSGHSSMPKFLSALETIERDGKPSFNTKVSDLTWKIKAQNVTMQGIRKVRVPSLKSIESVEMDLADYHGHVQIKTGNDTSIYLSPYNLSRPIIERLLQDFVFVSSGYFANAYGKRLRQKLKAMTK